MIELPLAVIEGVHLARIVDDFRELVDDHADSHDPAVARLTPDAYPDDAQASGDFSTGTRRDLLDRRLRDAGVVADALVEFDEVIETLTQEDAVAQRTIVIPDAELDAWLRTLTAIRLVLAARLGITEEASELDPADERLDVYDWLGYRLETLIEAADRSL
jgi:hypothetical protein